MGESMSHPEKTSCGGDACSSCGKCRDWYLLRDWRQSKQHTSSYRNAAPMERTWERRIGGTCGDGHPNEPTCRRHHFPDASYSRHEARGICQCWLRGR